MNPGQGGLGDKLLGGGQAERNPFGGGGGGIAQWKIIVAVVAVLALGTIMLQSLRADPTPEPVGISGKPASKPATLAKNADKEAWIGEAAGRVKKTEEKEAMLEQQLRELRDELRRKTDDMEKQLKDTKTTAAGNPKVAALAPSAQAATRASIPPPPQSALPPVPGGGQPLLASSPRPVQSMPPAPGVAGRPMPVQQGVPPPVQPNFNRIRIMSPDPQPVQGPGAPQKYWIPTGTIMPIKLLTGLDAPGKSASLGGEPHPVLMFVEDMSVLPNNVQMDMRECFVLGEGIGDLSEERAKIRTRSLSCVKDKEEKAVDIPLHGMVTGEDGKVGLRGPVVQREGAILAKALLAGFVNGISRVFMPYQQGFFVANSPNQAFNFPDPAQVAMAGVAGGMGGAAQTLARHYSQLAKEIYPIIEIDAGRQGNIIVTEGRSVPEAPL
jgi:conjugal transfer pilus assembly protein TraB